MRARRTAHRLALALGAVALCIAAYVIIGSLNDRSTISAREIATLRLASDQPPPLIEIAEIPTGTVAVYASNTDLPQLHFFLPPEEGLYPVERRHIGEGRDVFVDRTYYDASGVVRRVETDKVARSYPEGRCDAALGFCRYKAKDVHGGTWGMVAAETSIEGGVTVRKRLDLGAGAITVTYTISNRWNLPRTAEWVGDNGSYSAIELLEIRLRQTQP